jgi:hypothetical protein
MMKKILKNYSNKATKLLKSFTRFAKFLPDFEI